MTSNERIKEGTILWKLICDEDGIVFLNAEIKGSKEMLVSKGITLIRKAFIYNIIYSIIDDKNNKKLLRETNMSEIYKIDDGEYIITNTTGKWYTTECEAITTEYNHLLQTRKNIEKRYNEINDRIEKLKYFAQDNNILLDNLFRLE